MTDSGAAPSRACVKRAEDESACSEISRTRGAYHIQLLLGTLHTLYVHEILFFLFFTFITFVQTMDLYLEYVRIPHTEPIEHEFRWGQRAETEVSKAKILEFMGQLHDQDPQSWSQQYREAHSIPNPTQASTSSQR